MNSITENNNTFFLHKGFAKDVSEKELFLHEKRFSFVTSKTPNDNATTESDKEKNINDVWTKDNFIKRKIQNAGSEKSSMKINITRTWASESLDSIDEDVAPGKGDDEVLETKETRPPTPSSPNKEATSPSHHARRPMNAFLIFCKKHRPIVRQKFPNLENRGITRILGEWWAILDLSDKSAYTNLAKEYKDAFFSANPDFKWYKLPAPPLRTLSTRPITLPTKTSSPISSPTQVVSSCADFTPGKLADESQLGSLTSLLSPTSAAPIKLDTGSVDTKTPTPLPTATSTDLNTHTSKDTGATNLAGCRMHTPESSTKTTTSVPPKPIKKRIHEQFTKTLADNNKSIVRDIFDTKSTVPAKIPKLDTDDVMTSNQSTLKHENDTSNVTKQDLVDKVVDSIFSQNDVTLKESTAEKQKSREPRKSVRSCKGKRYAEFMVEGKLLGSKYNKRITQGKTSPARYESGSSTAQSPLLHKTTKQTPYHNLDDTIKRLSKVVGISESKEEAEKVEQERPRSSQSEVSDDGTSRTQSYFDLDLRIAELPSLSYDAFVQRKKANKKRKLSRHKSEENEPKAKDMAATSAIADAPKSEASFLVGSKKRKNKSSIMRLESPNDHAVISQFSNDLSGLATLAEIAANVEKIS